MAKVIKVNPAATVETALEVKTLSTAFSKASNGDTIQLRAGYFHAPFKQPLTKQLTIALYVHDEDTKVNVVTPLGNPCIDGLVYETTDDGWTYVSNGVFKKQSTAEVMRLWANMAKRGDKLGDRSDGTALRRCSNPKEASSDHPQRLTESDLVKRLVDEDSDWACNLLKDEKDLTLYVRTGSEQDRPVKFFNGLAWCSGSAMGYGFEIKASSVSIDRVDIRGGQQSFRIVTAPLATPPDAASPDTTAPDATELSNISISNCKATHMGSSAVFIWRKSGAPKISLVTVTNCIADLSTSEREQERDESTSYLGGGNDMFVISGAADGVRIEKCTSINAGHVAFRIGTIGNTGPSNSGYKGCKAVAADWTTYTRGTASFQCDESCYIEDCTFIGMNVRSQFGGKIKVTGCQWLQLRKGKRKAGVDGWFVVESYKGVSPEKVRISNCLFTPCYGNPIEFNAYTTDILENAITVENNLMLDFERDTAIILTTGLNKEKTTRIASQKVQGNVIGTVNNVDAKVKWHDEIVAINDVPGFSSNVNAGLNWPLQTLSTARSETAP